MIKVLMLGWEFPPHIAGGLGVACEGLTTALVNTDEVQILFVIPRAPESPQEKFTLKGANTIGVPHREGKTVTETAISSGSVAGAKLEVQPVDASLAPYEHPLLVPRDFLMKWNAVITTTEELQDVETTTHPFEGGYGTKLLYEVDKYAEVVLSFALENDFDVIHAHDWMTFPAAVAVKNATGRPLAIHVHATEFDRAGSGGSDVVYEIERMAIRSCDRAIAVSELTKKTLTERYGAPADRITVVHNGMKFKEHLPLSNESHPLGEQLVSFVGRVTFQKGPEYFVDAAEKVLKEFPDCHFVMAGAGDALPAMINRVISKRMSERFHFTGFLDRKDVERLLSYTRVFVMPSVSEPFGLTALEAVNAGVPAVISLQSGVSEILPDVLKVDFWDTDALAQAICGVLKYPLLYETMRHRALNSVATASWDSAASKVLTVYRELLSDVEVHSPSNP